MSKAVAVLMIAVLGVVTACGPSAATPALAPKPTATPAEVRATRTEHLEGIWRLGGEVGFGPSYGGRYYRWDSDGTVWWAEDPEMTTNLRSASYWFEDGVYHEGESPVCPITGSYEVYLRIDAGRAVRLRPQVIEDGFAIDACTRRIRYASSFARVD